ncbi:MAG: (4Fe-4S)-binding protein, partial [Mailhella sp.]
EENADALIDSPPGVSCPAMTVAREADVILLVIDPTPFGFHDFRLAHQAVLLIHRPLAAVINRAGAEGNAKGDEEVRAYCRQHGIPVLAELPFSHEAARQYSSGKLLADISPSWKNQFEKLRDAIAAFSTERMEEPHA